MGGYSRGGLTKRRRGKWGEQRGEFGAGLYGRLETVQLLQSRGWRHEEIVNEAPPTHVSFLLECVLVMSSLESKRVELVGKFIFDAFWYFG